MLLVPEMYDFDQWFMLLFVVFHSLSTVNFNEFPCVLETKLWPAKILESFVKSLDWVGICTFLFIFPIVSKERDRAFIQFAKSIDFLWISEA